MTLRRILFLTIALLIAVGTALIARSWVRSERAAVLASLPKQSEAREPHVLVAAKELAPGTFVKDSVLKWQVWPKDGVQKGYVVRGAAGKLADFTGAVVRTRILAGQPITRNTVVHPGERGFMAAVLAPGMRAVSVPVNATSGIAGFVFPGDKVDVIMTMVLPGTSRIKRHASQTLLSDVRVLAMDQVSDNTDGKAKVAKTATLEVSEKQAEQVALAMQMGTLSLSLRSLARDDQDGSDPATTVEAQAAKEKAGKDKEMRVVLASDERRAENKKKESYTLDRDIMFMSKKAGGHVTRRAVTVLRGDKAETAKF